MCLRKVKKLDDGTHHGNSLQCSKWLAKTFNFIMFVKPLRREAAPGISGSTACRRHAWVLWRWTPDTWHLKSSPESGAEGAMFYKKSQFSWFWQTWEPVLSEKHVDKNISKWNKASVGIVTQVVTISTRIDTLPTVRRSLRANATQALPSSVASRWDE